MENKKQKKEEEKESCVDLSDVKIKTERLVLRELVITDAEEVATITNNPNIANQMLYIPYPYKL